MNTLSPLSRLALTIVSAVALLGFAENARASAPLCISSEQDCTEHVKSSSPTPAYPSASSGLSLNPATVPINDGLGLEVIDYRNALDFSIVKGNGRVGAGLSLSNGQETFFGPPAFEVTNDYLLRHQTGDEYAQQTFSFATAIALFNNKKSGWKRFEFDLGVIAHYNKKSSKILPGAGLAVMVGPLTLGYAAAEAQDVVDLSSLGQDPVTVTYATETYTAGLQFESIALDYTYMRVFGQGLDNFTTQLFTGSLLLKRFILTYSYRFEDSNRPYYNPSSRTLVDQRQKSANFYGVQFAATKHVQIDAFYNYYLLNEISAGLTFFF